MPIIFPTVAHTGIYNATGHSKIPFMISATGLLLNMILDPLLSLHLTWVSKSCHRHSDSLPQFTVLTLFLIQTFGRDHLLGGFRAVTRLTNEITSTYYVSAPCVAVMNSLFAFINMSLGQSASLYGGHLGVMSLTTGGQLRTALEYRPRLLHRTQFIYWAKLWCQSKERIYKGVRQPISSSSSGVPAFVSYRFWGEEPFSSSYPRKLPISQEVSTYIQALPQIFSMLEITSQAFSTAFERPCHHHSSARQGNLPASPLPPILLPITQEITTLWWIIAISYPQKAPLQVSGISSSASAIPKEGTLRCLYDSERVTVPRKLMELYKL